MSGPRDIPISFLSCSWIFILSVRWCSLLPPRCHDDGVLSVCSFCFGPSVTFFTDWVDCPLAPFTTPSISCAPSWLYESYWKAQFRKSWTKLSSPIQLFPPNWRGVFRLFPPILDFSIDSFTTHKLSDQTRLPLPRLLPWTGFSTRAPHYNGIGVFFFETFETQQGELSRVFSLTECGRWKMVLSFFFSFFFFFFFEIEPFFFFLRFFFFSPFLLFFKLFFCFFLTITVPHSL